MPASPCSAHAHSKCACRNNRVQCLCTPRIYACMHAYMPTHKFKLTACAHALTHAPCRSKITHHLYPGCRGLRVANFTHYIPRCFCMHLFQVFPPLQVRCPSLKMQHNSLHSCGGAHSLWRVQQVCVRFAVMCKTETTVNKSNVFKGIQ